ncbi:unnamed protein product, partial [Prorocentrum cordatum]
SSCGGDHGVVGEDTGRRGRRRHRHEGDRQHVQQGPGETQGAPLTRSRGPRGLQHGANSWRLRGPRGQLQQPPRGGRPRGRGAAPPRGTLGGLRARGHGRTIGGCARRARVPTSARGPGEEEGGGRKDAQGAREGGREEPSGSHPEVFLRQGALLLGGGAVRAGAARTPGRAARQAGPGPRKPRRQFAPPGRSELPLYLCLVAPPSLPALNATWMAWVAEM